MYLYVIHSMCWTYDKSKGGDTRELQSRMVPPRKKLGQVTLTSLWTTTRENKWGLGRERRPNGKNKCLSKLPSRLVGEVGRLHWMTSFTEIRELLLFSVENNTIDEEEFLLLSEGFKSVNRLSDEKAWIEPNRIELVLLSYTFYGDYLAETRFPYSPIHLSNTDIPLYSRWSSLPGTVYTKYSKILLSRGRHVHLKTYKKQTNKKQGRWVCRCFGRFSSGFLTGLSLLLLTPVMQGSRVSTPFLFPVK